MATTGPALYPGSTTYPGSSVYPGGGTLPQVEVLYSTDDASEPTPAWQYVAAGDLRSYSVSRGRGNTLATHEAGTATIELSNRERAYDPNSGNFLPMDRWWIRTKFSGVTEDRFVGYADGYSLTWPERGKDSVTVIRATDELKVLNMLSMPAFEPAGAADYAGVIGADGPSGYWRWQDPLLMTTTVTETVTPPTAHEWYIWRHDPDRGSWSPETKVDRTSITEGSGWRVPTGGNYGIENTTPIVGDQYGSVEDGAGGSLLLTAGQTLQSTDTSAGDMLYENAGSWECWFLKESNPGVDTIIWRGPDSLAFPGTRLWAFILATTGAVQFWYVTAAGGNPTVSTAALTSSVFYHLVAATDGNNLRLYVDGALVATSAALGGATIDRAGNTGTPMTVQYAGANVYLDEMAVYPSKTLSASRISAHYTAGTARGYSAQLPSARVGAVLDTVGSHAPRSIRTATRTMYPAFMSGTALDMIRMAEACEAPNGMFFCSRSGELTFLDNDHRSSAPWTAVQVTFDDDGTDRPYWDAGQDLEEALIANAWSVTKSGRGKLTQSVTDTASIATYFQRTRTLSDLPLTTNADALDVATEYLAKFKDPFGVFGALDPDMSDAATCADVLALELGDKVEINRRPLGGGAVILLQSYVQSISESAKPGEPLRVTLAIGDF